MIFFKKLLPGKSLKPPLVMTFLTGIHQVLEPLLMAQHFKAFSEVPLRLENHRNRYKAVHTHVHLFVLHLTTTWRQHGLS